MTGEQLHAPHVVDSEVASGLRRHVMSGRIAADVGWAALDAWRRLGLTRYASHGLSPAASAAVGATVVQLAVDDLQKLASRALDVLTHTGRCPLSLSGCDRFEHGVVLGVTRLLDEVEIR